MKKDHIIQFIIIVTILNIIGGLYMVRPVGAAKKIPFIGTMYDGTGLIGVYAVTVSPDGKHLYTVSRSLDFLAVFSRDETTGALTFVEMKKDGAGGVDGLNAVTSVTVSPDGKYLYTASEFDNAVTVFSRDETTGALMFVEMKKDGVDGVDGLSWVTSVTISPDGKYLYSVSGNDDAVVVFSRDGATGLLTFVEMKKDGVDGVDGLDGGSSVTISADGKHLYAVSQVDDGVVVFSRDEITGALTFVEMKKDGVDGVDGLDWVNSVTISPDGKYLYSASGNDKAVAVFSRDGVTGALTFVEMKKDGVDGVDGLNWVTSVTISPDGKHLYATGSTDSAIAVFSRDVATGALTYVEMKKDGVDGVDGLWGARSATVSPDGKHLYAAGISDQAVPLFSRDAVAGVLAFVEMKKDGVGGIDGLAGVTSVTISPDGKHLYAAAASDDAVVVFSRDGMTGALTYVEMKKDGVDGVDGLDGATSVTVSPDGKHLYTTAASDDAVAVFSRDATTGALTFVEMKKDGVDGVDGLNGATLVTVSPDGKHLYVAGVADDAVAVFSRDGATGALTFVEMKKDEVDGADGLEGASSVTTSPDGKYLYIAGRFEHTVAVFSRDAATGALTFVEIKKDGTGGVDGLRGVYSVMVSSDGKYLYAASEDDNAVAVFSRDAVAGVLTFVEMKKDGAGGIDGLDGARSVTISPNSKYLYVAGNHDNSVAVFSRDETTGGLTFIETRRDGFGINAADGLDSVSSVAVSPDSKYLYAAGSDDNAIAYFGNSLFLSKEVDQLNPQPGQALTYRLTISNTSVLAASGGILSDTLPSGINFVGPITLQGGSGTPGSPPLLVTNLALPAGQTMTITLPVTVSTELASGTAITNTATISSTEVETPVAAQITAIIGGDSYLFLPVILRD